MTARAPLPGAALVTGGSSGIGFELACRAAEEGRQIVLVARDAARLASAADAIRARYRVDVATHVADLATDDGIAFVSGALLDRYPQIDLLINCAGIAHGGDFLRHGPAAEIRVARVNMEATLRITHACAQRFAQQGKGAILNVASLAAFQAGPYLANYYASKAYVLMLTEGLARELAPHGVRMSVLCPGTTRTGFHEKAGIAQTALAQGLFGIVMDPATVSRIAYRGLQAGQVVIIPGLVNKLAAFGVRLAPRALSTLITAFINRPGRAA